MNYYEDRGLKGKVLGWLGVVAYLVAIVAVMFLSYRVEPPEPAAGILVDFGSTDTGFGQQEVAVVTPEATPQEAPPVSETPPEETAPVMTTDQPDAPPVVPPETPAETPPETLPEPEPVREVNQRALFPGRTSGDEQASQGSTQGTTGDQGAAEGSPGSSGFSLVGRYGVGDLPKPKYPNSNLSGIVVIRIVVDREGKVINVSYQQASSTMNDNEFVQAALAAARLARFTRANENDSDVQAGTITYVFSLKSE